MITEVEIAAIIDEPEKEEILNFEDANVRLALFHSFLLFCERLKGLAFFPVKIFYEKYFNWKKVKPRSCLYHLAIPLKILE